MRKISPFLSSGLPMSLALASCLVAIPLFAHNAPAVAPTQAPAPAAPAPVAKPPITTSAGYLNAGKAELARLEADKPNNRRARNVIIFIGRRHGA